MQQALLRRVVAELRDAGSEVVSGQVLMRPAAQDYDDPARGEEFLRFAASLEAELGARFVPASALEPLAESDYYDLIHVNHAGAAKVTRGILAGLARAGIGAEPGPFPEPQPARPAKAARAATSRSAR